MSDDKSKMRNEFFSCFYLLNGAILPNDVCIAPWIESNKNQFDSLNMVFHEDREAQPAPSSPHTCGEAILALSTPNPWVKCSQHHTEQRQRPAEPSPGLSHEQIKSGYYFKQLSLGTVCYAGIDHFKRSLFTK